MITPAHLRNLLALVPPRRRRQAGWLFLLMIAGAAADLLTIGALVPFLALLAGSEGRHVPGWMASLPLSWAAVLFIAAALAAGGLRLLLAARTQDLAAMTGHDCAVEIQRRLLLQPYGYHLQQHSSTLIAALGKVDDLVWRVLFPLLQGAAAGLISLAIFIALLLVEPLLATAALLGFGGLYLLISRQLRPRLQRIAAELNGRADQRIRLVQESHGAIRDIILDGSASVHVEQFRRTDLALSRAHSRYSLLAAAPRFLVEAIGLSVIAALALWLSGQPGGLLPALPLVGALALGAQRLLPLLQQLYQSWAALTASEAILSDVQRLLRLPLPPASSVEPTPLPFEAELRMEEVSFAYPERDRPAVQDISFALRRGERVALTGRTGSGKSTLADLLMGLLTPQSGRLIVDGRPVGPAEQARWRRSIAHVPQTIFLTDDTIAANVAFGVPVERRDPARLARAVRLAQLEEFVADLPLGLETRVGEDGVRLSGGQRQRIGLARAIYREAPLLVLDEATSALDNETEAAVRAALDALQAQGTTILIIAHRRSALTGCDRLLRLDAGRIVAIEEQVAA